MKEENKETNSSFSVKDENNNILKGILGGVLGIMFIVIVIGISTYDPMGDKREEIIKVIWDQDELPNTLPSDIELELTKVPFKIEDASYLAKVDKLIVNQEYGIDSIIYHLQPKYPINRLMIYHHGHTDNLSKAEPAISQFLESGFSVMVIQMPLMGTNPTPPIPHWIDIPVYNEIGSPDGVISGHYQLEYLESEDFSPLKLFMNPVLVSINYVETKYNYESISMMGLSGGGWTTTLYAALDERIIRSYPIAGSLPLDFNTPRDYEQYLPTIWEIVSYRDLYLLGSSGKGRVQIQILNSNDECCFQGDYYNQLPYEDEINEARKGEGNFEVFICYTDEHIICNLSLLKIVFEEEKSL